MLPHSSRAFSSPRWRPRGGTWKVYPKSWKKSIPHLHSSNLSMTSPSPASNTHLLTHFPTLSTSKATCTGTSLGVWWLRLSASTAGAAGGILKIPHATCCSQNKTNLKNKKATQEDSRGTWGGHVTWCWWGASPVSDGLYRPFLGAGLRLLTWTHAREEPRVKTQPSANGIATVRNQCCSGTPGWCFTEHPVR